MNIYTTRYDGSQQPHSSAISLIQHLFNVDPKSLEYLPKSTYKGAEAQCLLCVATKTFFILGKNLRYFLVVSHIVLLLLQRDTTSVTSLLHFGVMKSFQNGVFWYRKEFNHNEDSYFIKWADPRLGHFGGSNDKKWHFPSFRQRGTT